MSANFGALHRKISYTYQYRHDVRETGESTHKLVIESRSLTLAITAVQCTST